MWSATALAGVMTLTLAWQVVDTRACPPKNSSGGSTPTTPVPSSGVLTTRDGVRYRVETLVTMLEIPWSMAFAPDGRLFVTERPGRVRIFSVSGSTSALALTLDDVSHQGEGGLLGLALDPQFAQTAFVYLYYTASVASGAVNRVVRYREVGGRLAERAVLLDNIPAAQIHDGGRLRFGPDGLLYITAGDAASPSLAQDVASLAGKILRITRDGTTPAGNPFGSPVYSYGHRNPQGIDWSVASGELWESEHGNSGNDEITAIGAGTNYGWPTIEGAAPRPGMSPPVTFFSPAIAPSGATFYRGTQFAQFTNNLFVATLRGTHLLRLTIDAQRITAQERLLDGTFGRLRDVIVGPDGNLYVCTNNRDGRGSPVATDDRILRLVPAS